MINFRRSMALTSTALLGSWPYEAHTALFLVLPASSCFLKSKCHQAPCWLSWAHAAFKNRWPRWLDDFPRAKLVVVMVRQPHSKKMKMSELSKSDAGWQVLMPLILNVFALWTADSFLQARNGAGALLPLVIPCMPEAKANDSDEVQVP